MKKAQSEEKEELNVVYSFLKILTLTGGLALTSLTLIGHTLITRFKEDIAHQVAAKQPVPVLDIQPVAELPEVTSGSDVILPIENQSVKEPPKEVVAIEKPVREKKNHMAVFESEAPKTTGASPAEPVTHAAETYPSAQIDVFPAGYGTFRILIESDTSDHFTATLSDMVHQEIVTEQYNVAQGKNEFLLDSGEIPRGDYVLKVSNGIITSQKRVTLK